MSLQRYEYSRGQALNAFLSCPDLLHLTFEHCLPEGSVLLHPNHAPLKLTFVCKYWKDIIETSATFWNRFRLELVGVRTKEDLKAHWRLLEYCLKLSRTLPLKIAVIKPDKSTEELDVELWNFFQVLREHMHRWLDVEFKLSGEVLEDTDYGDTTFNAPMLRKAHLDFSNECLADRNTDTIRLLLRHCLNLEELSVRGRRMQEEEEDLPTRSGDKLPVIYCFRCPPNLKVLEMDNIYFSRPFSSGAGDDNYIFFEDGEDDEGEIDPLVQAHLDKGFCAFWPTNVWKLVFNNVEINPDFLDSFDKFFPCLTWLEIRNSYRHWFFDYSYGSPLVEGMKLLKLQHLSLMVCEWRILLNLKAPEVTWLELDEGYPKQDNEDVPDNRNWQLKSDFLIAFVNANKLALTTFKLTSVTITEDELIKILQHLPSLQDLSLNIKDHQLTDEFLYALTYKDPRILIDLSGVKFVGGGKLCPSLSKLRIEPGTEGTEHKFSVDTVIELARSRGDAFGMNGWVSLELPLTEEDMETVLRSASVRVISTLGKE